MSDRNLAIASASSRRAAANTILVLITQLYLTDTADGAAGCAIYLSGHAAQCNQRNLAAASRHGCSHAGRRSTKHPPWTTCHARGVPDAGDGCRHVLLLRGVCPRHQDRSAAAAADWAHP